MEAKHTPGPWTTDDDETIRGATMRDLVADCRVRRVTTYGIDRDRSETAANARLIAAAPDLLAALTDLCHAFHRDTRGDDVPPKYRKPYAAARAAIARATGGAR